MLINLNKFSRARYLLGLRTHNTRLSQTPLLIVDTLLQTPISTLKNIKVNSGNILPNSQLNLNPNFKTEIANFTLPLTGTNSPKHGYDTNYKAIAKLNIPKASTNQFHNRLVVGWDIETLAINQVETAYIISWVVTKGNKRLRGVVTNISSDWMRSEKQLKMVEEFLIKLILDIKKLNRDKNPRTVYIYAHNSGIFDLHVVIPIFMKIHIANTKMIPEIIADKDNDIYQLSIIYKGRTLVLRDSIKVIPISLKSVADRMLGGEYSKITIDHNTLREIITNKPRILGEWGDKTLNIIKSDNIPKEYDTPIDYLKAYCIQDSIIVVKGLAAFSINISKLGYTLPIKTCITASSIGIYIWKSYFLSYDRPIIQIHLNTLLHGELNKSYVGGRVEVFDSAIRYDKIYHFDVPGLYAGIMQKPLPIGNPTFVTKFNKDLTQETIINIIKELHNTGKVAFFKCEVITPIGIKIPVLPIKHQGKLTFPLGQFAGTWFRVELLKAIEYGYQVKLVEGWIFNRGTPLKSYSETLSQLKDKAGLEGNKPLRTAMKLLTNSLYGKFASKYQLTTTKIISGDELPTLNELYKINSITKVDIEHIIVNHNIKPIIDRKANKFLKDKAYINASKALADKDLNVAVASAVTAYGRVQLFELMIEIEGRGGNICYTDTDSVFCTLPEAPFNKPFGPYTWVGPAEEHTFNKALFIAPKIYYLEDLNGKITFKVKGVSTKASEYTYEDLTYTFIKGTSIKFTNQTQFRHIPKHKGLGIMIIDNLAKEYELQISSKRNWEIDTTRAWTTPLIVDTTKHNTKAISKLPECNIDIIIKTIQDKGRLNPIIATRDTTTHGEITQYLRDMGSAVNITIPTIKVKDQFTRAWNHALRTAALNTNIFDDKDIRRIQSLQILVKDSNIGTWKTLAYFKTQDWLGYNNADILREILNQIRNLNMEYDAAYNWDTIVIKLNFRTVVTLAEYRAQIPIYKLAQDISAATKEYETIKSLKKEIDNNQIKMDAIQTYSNTTKQLIDITTKAYEAVIEEFQTAARMAMYKNIQNKITIDDQDITRFKQLLKIPINTELSEVRIALSTRLIQSLKMVIQRSFKIEFHAWHNTFMKLNNLSLRDEATIRIVIRTIHIAITVLEHEGFLKLFLKGKVVADSHTNFKTTPYIMEIAPKWNSILATIQSLGLLTKTRFIPKTLKYDPERTDQTLRSIDKVNQINQYNSVKIQLHPLYGKLIDSMIPETQEDKDRLIKLLRLQKEGKWNAFIIEIGAIVNTKNIIETFIENFRQPFYYNNHFTDRRGRVYPELTNFRYIGAKWLRPLFCLENSHIILNTFPTLAKTRMANLPQSRRDAMATYWVLVAEIVNLNISNYNTPQEFLKDLKDLTTDQLDPNLAVRIMEIEYMINHGIIPITAPFQIDMKNNAIQHAGTIVNNIEAMKATGVINTPGTPDIYTQVAIATLKHLKEIEPNKETTEILRVLNPKRPETLRIMRTITKRPTIVIAYSATQITIIEYIFDTLVDKGITLNKEARTLLAKTIINKAIEFLSKEVMLMKELKNIINKDIPHLKWNFGNLTDFTVKDTYFKLDNKEIKIRHQGKQFHTRYNVVTSKVDVLGMKNAVFVNIIHSLDALHLIKVSLKLTDKRFITIHDAYLINWNYNRIELTETINRTFVEIHNNHIVFKPIVNRLAQRLGNHIGYEQIITKINTKPPTIKNSNTLLTN